MTWVRVSAEDGLGPHREIALAGSTWFGALTPSASALIAAIAVLPAARGGWRQLLGVVVAVLAAATSVPALTLLTHAGVTVQRAHALAELPGRARVTELHPASAAAVLALVGAVLAFGAGVWLARKPSGAGLSGRYDTPAVRRAESARRMAGAVDGEISQRALWDAIDAGEDPTADTVSGTRTRNPIDADEVRNTPGEKPGQGGLYS